jgi:hypothetical protein
MSFWKRLFGGKSDETDTPAQGEEYNGFRIIPAPIREGGQYRVAARIEKDGRSHDLIRADTMGSQDEAIAASIRKARQIIDEQGDRLFRP